MKVHRIPTAKKNNRHQKLDTIVLHWTATTFGARDELARMRRFLTDPSWIASTHFIVMRNGDLIVAAGLKFVTWHAGNSVLDGRRDVNARSIGVDLVSCGPIYRRKGRFFDSYGTEVPRQSVVVGFDGALYERPTDAQRRTFNRLIRALTTRIPRVVRHCDVAVPSGRKIDTAGLIDLSTLELASEPV